MIPLMAASNKSKRPNTVCIKSQPKFTEEWIRSNFLYSCASASPSDFQFERHDSLNLLIHCGSQRVAVSLCSVAWTRLHAGAPFISASCWARPRRNVLDTARWGPLRCCHSSVHFPALCAPSNKSNDGFEDSFSSPLSKELQPSPGKSAKRFRQKEFSTVYWLLAPGVTYKCGLFQGFILDMLNIFKPHTFTHLLQLYPVI